MCRIAYVSDALDVVLACRMAPLWAARCDGSGCVVHRPEATLQHVSRTTHLLVPGLAGGSPVPLFICRHRGCGTVVC